MSTWKDFVTWAEDKGRPLKTSAIWMRGGVKTSVKSAYIEKSTDIGEGVSKY